MAKLGVNVDHVATIRQARRIVDPDPVAAARMCEAAGCHSIVCHLREDRRHINDDDVHRMRRSVRTIFNLEMSIAPDIVAVACKVKPDYATLVPEKRQELTTEGGLDLFKRARQVGVAIERLHGHGIDVSLFIEPDAKTIRQAAALGARIIELHTGRYANATDVRTVAKELEVLKKACAYALDAGLTVNAGHGLSYTNAARVAGITGVEELNIGHSIISYAVFFGLDKAVRTMVKLIA
ncbi:MAG: pyridoxine 5'-phosphate synthase [Candidatus Omnitrophica bacterium]|nr:pyridoxine 5'-phosphate synthase [Candidatus Omnitrophota bacterium]